MNSIDHSAYVSVDGLPVAPECITRFSPGTRVEVYRVTTTDFLVKAVPTDVLSVFGEEKWQLSVTKS